MEALEAWMRAISSDMLQQLKQLYIITARPNVPEHLEGVGGFEMPVSIANFETTVVDFDNDMTWAGDAGTKYHIVAGTPESEGSKDS